MVARAGQPPDRLSVDAGSAVEALAETLLACLLTRLPEKHYFRILRLTRAEGEVRPAGADELFAARVTGHRVKRLAERLPLRAVCLQQAIATHRMLRRRNVPSQILFGLRLKGGGEAGRGPDAAHAWVVVGGETVSGLIEGLEEYAVLARYA